MVGIHGHYPNSNLNCVSRESYGYLAGGWIPYSFDLATGGYPLHVTGYSAKLDKLIYMHFIQAPHPNNSYGVIIFTLYFQLLQDVK